MYETKRQAFQRATRAVERARDKVTTTDLDTANGRTLGEAVDMLRAIDAGEVDPFDDRLGEIEDALYLATTEAQEAHPEAPISRALTAALCVIHLCRVRTDAEASVIADDADEIESGTRPDPVWQTGLSEKMVTIIRGTITKFKATVAELEKPPTGVTFPISAGGAQEATERAMRAVHKQGAIDALTTLLTVAGFEFEAVETPSDKPAL